MKTMTFARSAEIEWTGDVLHGSGRVRASSQAFEILVTFPTLRGDPPGTTTPEELLAASHATCFGIGLRSVIAREGGAAARIVVTATITAEKGRDGIRVRESHLAAVIEGAQRLDFERLSEIGMTVERECTISSAIRASVRITHEVTFK